MAKQDISNDGSELQEVQITIVVVPGRVRTTLATFLARARVRAGLVFGGLLVAVAAAAIIAVASSSERASRPPGSDALATQFGLRLNCSRLTVVSPDGAYARIDLDHAGPCGTFGNQVTLILHRYHGVWVRKLEASSWTCPMRRLPQPVVIELQLCRSNRVATSTGDPLSKIPLDH
jgi:hypothetical protein